MLFEICNDVMEEERATVSSTKSTRMISDSNND